MSARAHQLVEPIQHRPLTPSSASRRMICSLTSAAAPCLTVVATARIGWWRLGRDHHIANLAAAAPAHETILAFHHRLPFLANRVIKHAMKIATWNVNSVNARLPMVLDVLKTCEADVWCLQEIKCIDEKFPREEIEALGFNCAVFGQKTYNGVALLSKHRISDEVRGLPGEPEDEQSRYLEVLIESPRPMRVASVYLPNGNPRPGDKYEYKLRWMDRLIGRAAELLESGRSHRPRRRLQLHPAR